MITTTLYKYDIGTKEYIGSIKTSNISLKDMDGYTDIAPPTNPGGKKYVFEKTKWKTLKAPGTSISTLRDHTNIRINNIAESFRTNYITLEPGQIMVYDEKYNEAVDYVAKKYPKDLKDFPYIAAEVSATNETPTDISNTILSRRKDCMRINAKVEEYRLHTKLSIKTATTKSELDSLVSGFSELLASIKL